MVRATYTHSVHMCKSWKWEEEKKKNWGGKGSCLSKGANGRKLK